MILQLQYCILATSVVVIFTHIVLPKHTHTPPPPLPPPPPPQPRIDMVVLGHAWDPAPAVFQVRSESMQSPTQSVSWPPQEAMLK
jgi:hypothetical protein